MSGEWKRKFADASAAGKPTAEYKTENIINRKTGAAEHPRTGERLLLGTEFEGEILLHVYDRDDAREMTDFVRHGLGVIQNASSLGAGGSRGSGKVTFLDIKEEMIPLEKLTV